MFVPSCRHKTLYPVVETYARTRNARRLTCDPDAADSDCRNALQCEADKKRSAGINRNRKRGSSCHGAECMLCSGGAWVVVQGTSPAPSEAVHGSKYQSSVFIKGLPCCMVPVVKPRPVGSRRLASSGFHSGAHSGCFTRLFPASGCGKSVRLSNRNCCRCVLTTTKTHLLLTCGCSGHRCDCSLTQTT